MAQVTRFRVDPGWLPVLKELGISISELLQVAELPVDLLAREAPALTIDQYFRFWRALETVAGAEKAPLAIGRAVTVGAFNAPILAALFSPNLITCFERLGRFKRLVGPMALLVDESPQGTSVRLDIFSAEHPIPASLVATELVFMVSLVRLATRTHVKPIAVEASVDLRSSGYKEFFGVVPFRGDKNVIRFSLDDSHRPFLTENKTMWQFYEADLIKDLEEMERDTSFAARLQTVIVQILPSGRCGIDDVARKLNLSARTIQRHLGSEGTTFQDQLNRARELLAKHYLAKSHLSGAEISYLLGYDDPNSFPRAFHRWTGMSPDIYRKKSSLEDKHSMHGSVL